VQTFLVRVWTPAAGSDAPGDLRGVVEHVGTGRRRTFRSERDAVVFIRNCLDGAHGGEDPATP
jgi:hypothetical protein